MAARYTNISESEMRGFLEPLGFTWNMSLPGNEMVFEVEHSSGRGYIRVYSSVQIAGRGAGEGRDVGKDAIRVVVLAKVVNQEGSEFLKPVFKGKRVHRVENWRNNLHNRLHIAFATTHEKACPYCGAMLVQREGKFGVFYSCANWSLTGCQGKA